MTARGESRERMLIGAALLFREQGVAGTSLIEIMQRTSAPRGSMYHHFPGGKAQLAEEATEYAGRTMARIISDQLAAGGPEGAITAFIDLFRQHLLDSDYTAGCPVAAAGMTSDDTPGARTRAGEAFTAWESTLSSALWQHGLQVHQAEELATIAIAAIEGALIMARAQRDTRPLDRIETFLHRHLDAVTGAKPQRRPNRSDALPMSEQPATR